MKLFLATILLSGIAFAQSDASLSASPATLPSGTILVGNAVNKPQARKIYGDAVITNTGALIFANSGAVAGTYRCADITVDSKGRVVVASSSTIESDVADLKNEIENLKQQIKNLTK